MVTLLTRNLLRKLPGMSAFTTVIVRISKTKTKGLTAEKISARNLIYLQLVIAITIVMCNLILFIYSSSFPFHFSIKMQIFLTDCLLV